MLMTFPVSFATDRYGATKVPHGDVEGGEAWKTIGKAWENENFKAKPWENHGKTIGKWEIYRKTMGKS